MDSKIPVLITRDIPEIGIELLENNGFLVHLKHAPNREDLNLLCKKHAALLSSSKDHLDRSFLEENSHLKIISQFSAGLDNIDLDAARELGIPIGHAPMAMNRATSDIAFGLMLACSRNFFGHYTTLLEGQTKDFKPKENLGIELYGKTLGVFGLGNIGMEMARKCLAAFDMKLIYHNRNRNIQAEKEFGARYVPFEKLLNESDVLSVHADLNPSTESIFSAVAFKKMKVNSIIINTSRGKLVNHEDLAFHIKNGPLFGAGLDVTDPEPLPKNHELLKLPNVCVLPHIGSATIEARDSMSKIAAQNIVQFFKNGSMVHRAV